ncbi:MAG TPA: cytochrome P450 [Aggregatilineales bacterium]|nr:cytochrome P450 [Anaerolineales bacterium]HRE48999.1 cytochrome P450 [Aggregatilineales bacterium]
METVFTGWRIGETAAPLPTLAPGMPILGNAIQMGGDTVAFLTQLYHKLGAIFRVRALTRELTILGGLAANEFMAKEGDNVLSGREFFGGLNKEMGSSLVFPALDGAVHNHYRRLFRPAYSREMIAPRFEALTALTRQRIRAWQGDEVIRVVPTMQKVITDQLGTALVGAASGDYFEALRDTLRYMIMVKIMRSAPEFILKLPMYTRQKARAAAFMRELLERHRSDDAETNDLIDTALNAVGHDGKPLSDGDLNAIGFGAFFAGMDTAAHTTSFTLYTLLKHPEVLQQVVAEVDDLFGRASFTLHDLRALKALHGAVVETMRLYPVAPIMPRHAIKTFEFGGRSIPEGASVMMVTALTHYLPEHFPDPFTFKLDRPLPAPYTYAPFGLGAHTCMGAGLADVLITLSLATIFHTVELALEPADFQMKVIGVPVPNPGQKFHVRVVRLRHNE